MDGELKYIHVTWISAIPAGMTGLNKLVYNDKRSSVGTIQNAPPNKRIKQCSIGFKFFGFFLS